MDIDPGKTNEIKLLFQATKLMNKEKDHIKVSQSWAKINQGLVFVTMN